MATTIDLDLKLLLATALTRDVSDRDGLQSLVNGLFSLERSASDSKSVLLPLEPKTRLPRQHPLPKEKIETRWEKFAKEKGIQKKKKERMIFDEPSQEWKPSWGHGRAVGTGFNQAPIIELKRTDPDDMDPFEKHRDAKKMKMLKQKSHELKNLELKRGKKGEREDMMRDPLKDHMESNKKRLRTVQTSTRSYGRFDEKVKNEPERKIEDKRRKFSSNVSDAAQEKDRAMKILKRMTGS